MTAFFVLTDRAVEGPFSGIELREAALAGILRHDGIVSAGPQGPWYKASDIGLFSDKKTPLPHPPDTHVPQYQVRGMPGAFQGPFKLRELIGFAARGMLPPEALLRVDDSGEWIAAQRFRVIAACLNGNLVLIDESGKVLVRNASATGTNDAPQVDGARAPIELAKSADMEQVTSLAPSVLPDVEPEVWPTQPRIAVADDETERPPSMLSRLWARFRPRLPDIQVSIPPRLAIQLVCILLVLAGVASAFSYWKQLRLQRYQVIGDWIALSDTDDSPKPTFGISLQKDGHCVIFNTRGESWTGGFEWDERSDDQAGFEHIAPFSTFFDEIEPSHQAGVVKPTDGYVRLQGFVKRPPRIDGHPVRDLFLRRDGNQLRIGYLTSVHWSEDAKTMEAGWVVASRSRIIRPDINADLRGIEMEVPVPMEEYGGGNPLHVSDAIVAVQSGVATNVGGEETILHESLAYSTKVNATYLLEEYGLPDESRRIYPFELPQIRNGPSWDGAQYVKYGDLKFILSHEGQLRYLALVPEPKL